MIQTTGDLQMDKTVTDLESAVAPIPDGASVMIGGFGSSGIPFGLIDALLAQGATGLTVISIGKVSPSRR